MMKTCTKCLVLKELYDFDFRNKSKGTKQAHCKVCRKIMVDSHYRANVKTYLDRNKRTRQRNLMLVGEAKDKPCTRCDKKYPPRAMDLHHRESSEKEEIVSRLAHLTSTAKLKRELEKCDVLCATCHRIVTFYPELA